MRKYLTISIVILLIFTAFTGCGGARDIHFEPQSLADELLKSEAFSDILSPITPVIASALFGVEQADIESCSVYCSTGATAEEIAVFRCSDEAAAQRVELGAKARAQSQKEAYESYAPQEIPKLDAASIRRAGVYVVYIVAEDSATIAPILDRFMK